MQLDHTLSGWVLGLIVSMGAGYLAAACMSHRLRKWYKTTVTDKRKQTEDELASATEAQMAMAKKAKEEWAGAPLDTGRIPQQPKVIGIVERLFFTILVAFAVPGVAAGIGTWILVKMASGWNRTTSGDEVWRRMLAFNGLICSMTSLFFAVVGGLLANGLIRLGPWIHDKCDWLPGG